MKTEFNITLTDSLERELVRNEISYINEKPLVSFFSWLGTLVRGAQNKVVNLAAEASSDMDKARAEGHKVTAA